jgi:hypothetical protein
LIRCRELCGGQKKKKKRARGDILLAVVASSLMAHWLGGLFLLFSVGIRPEQAVYRR